MTGLLWCASITHLLGLVEVALQEHVGADGGAEAQPVKGPLDSVSQVLELGALGISDPESLEGTLGLEGLHELQGVAKGVPDLADLAAVLLDPLGPGKEGEKRR